MVAFILSGLLTGCVIPSAALGVGQNPEPVPPMGRADGASWNNKRPDGEAVIFQL